MIFFKLEHEYTLNFNYDGFLFNYMEEIKVSLQKLVSNNRFLFLNIMLHVTVYTMVLCPADGHSTHEFPPK